MAPANIAVPLLLAVAGGIALLFALWLYYDRRDRRFYDATRRRATFTCLKCSHVYTGGEAEEICPCPRCGHPNPRLRF